MGIGLLRLPVAFATAAAMFFGSMLTALPVSAGSSNMQALINQDRASNGGLAPLTWSECLSAVAIQNVQRMVAQGYISHSNGVQLDLACGTGASRSSGENVGYISSGIDDAVMNNLYMNSPGHRANILGAFQYVATAWAVAPNGYAYSAEEFLAASAPLVPGGYVPLSPTRILDTRVGNGAPVGAVGPGATLTVQVSGRGGIPATIVAAVVLNVTVTNTTVNGGYLIVYPKEDPRPLASNLNWSAGQTVPNLLEVGLGYSGQLNIYTAPGAPTSSSMSRDTSRRSRERPAPMVFITPWYRRASSTPAPATAAPRHRLDPARSSTSRSPAAAAFPQPVWRLSRST